MIEIGRKIREFLQCTFVGVIVIKPANVKSMLFCRYDIARQKTMGERFFLNSACMRAT